jgi:hypothetical protein
MAANEPLLSLLRKALHNAAHARMIIDIFEAARPN